MRVVLAASSYLPHFGGVEEHVFHLARELRARRHDVAIWSVEREGPGPSEDGGIPLRYLPSPLPNRSLTGIAQWSAAFPRASRAWSRAFAEDAPDVVMVQCFGANGPWATAMAHRKRVPFVYANHGETFMDAHNAFESSGLLRRSLSKTLAQASAVTSCSAFAAADLQRFGAPPGAHIVGNGIDLLTPGEEIPTALPARYFAGVGRLVENKGFDVLLRAYARAQHDVGDTGLVIAGEGPGREYLQGLAAELGIAPRVRFVGALNRGQVRTLLDGAVAHVVPSRIEAFGIVILEGWRTGIPVISTDKGGPADVITDGVDGLLFDPDDPGRLSDLLSRVARDEGLRTSLGAEGRRSVTRYSWARVTDVYQDVLRSIFPGEELR